MNCQHHGCPCQNASIERDGKKFCSEKYMSASVRYG